MASVSFFVGAAQITPGAGAQELGKQLSTAELNELRNRLESILREAKKRVVVQIDDIDRLDRQEIQAIFKLIKLSAGFENTAYVLAFDDEVVADALGEKYGAGGAIAGRSFLEKIVQVPLHLPSTDQLSLRQLTFEGVDAALKLSGIELNEEQTQAFVRHFIDGLEMRLSTPRQAKRYANALSFALPILKDEVHPVDQMLIEGIRVFYPSLYTIIRENVDIFLRTGQRLSRDDSAENKRATDTIAKGLEGLDATEQQAAKDLIQVLFPRVKGVYGNTHYGSDWDERWEREQRVCSDEYFHRYFSYAVPPRDIPDQVLMTFLEAAKTLDEDEIGVRLREFAGGGAAPQLVHKLRRVEGTIDALTARKLAVAVTRNGAIFPKEKGTFAFTSTFNQAAILAIQLVRQIPPGSNREDLARRIIKEAEPLPFGFECFRWLRPGKDEPETERTIPASVEEEFGQILAYRVRDAAAKEPPYLSFPDGAPALLWIWNKYGEPAAVENYLSDRFQNNPQEAPKFLLLYVGLAWGMESRLSHRSDFMRENYDSVCSLINPELVLNHLRSVYGPEVDTVGYHPSRELPDEQRIAYQFTSIHRGIKDSKADESAEVQKGS